MSNLSCTCMPLIPSPSCVFPFLCVSVSHSLCPHVSLSILSLPLCLIFFSFVFSYLPFILLWSPLSDLQTLYIFFSLAEAFLVFNVQQRKRVKWRLKFWITHDCHYLVIKTDTFAFLRCYV